MSSVEKNISISFAVLLSALIALLFLHTDNEKTQAFPSGEPPTVPTIRSTPYRLATPKSPEESLEEPRVGTASPTPNRTNRGKARMRPLEPVPEKQHGLTVRRHISHQFTATVRSRGKPLEGATIVAHVFRYGVSGYKMSQDPFSILCDPSISRSGADGRIQGFAYFLESTSKNTECGVAAFHPTDGTGYLRLPLDELLDTDIEIELDVGEFVVGHVFDEQNTPLAGAWVQLSCAYPVDGVSLNGLGVLTGSDGWFEVPGVRFGNTPVSVTVRYVPLSEHEKSTLTAGFDLRGDRRPWSGRADISVATHDAAAGVWNLGDIRLSPSKRRPAFK